MKAFLKLVLFIVLLFLAVILGLGVYCQDVNPIDNGVLPFFGLVFPLFFVLNLFALLVLFIGKRVLLIIPLVALVYAYPSSKNYFKIFAKSEFSKEDIKEIKLLTYNVRIFDANENIGGNIKDRIFSSLKDQDANIMCFQEYYYVETPGLFDTKSIIQEELMLPNHHENLTHHMRGGLHSGVATFTSLPIVNKGSISFDSDNNNTCIYTDIVIDNDTVRVYNTHLSSIRFQHEDYELVNQVNDEVELSDEEITAYKRIYSLMDKAYKKRSLQLQKILDHIYECPYPVVLAGDFNDTPVSYCYAQTRKYLTDSFVESGSGIGNTYIGDFPSFRIDYIFHSEEIESAAYKTLPEELSDHHAVYTKLRVKPL